MDDEDVTYSSRHIEQLLQCSVCLDRFKTPKLLPCQHTYCQSPCLEQLINPRTRMIKCPECRADHLVPRGGTSSFPNNITVMGFMDLPRLSLGMAGEPRLPTHRNEGGVNSVKLSETEAYCKKTSGTYVPETCSGYGGYSYGDDQGIDPPVAAPPPPRTTCSCCFRTSRLSQCHHCQQQICDICVRQHMEQVKVEIERMIYRIKRGMPKISNAIDDIGAKGSQAQQRCESAKSEINDIFERLIRDFKIRQRSLMDQVDTFLISELENLRTQQESLEVELASLASFCDSSESAVGHGGTADGAELMLLHEQCEENCNITQNFEGSHMRRITVRQIDVTANTDSLSETIAAFGEIEISARPGTRGANMENRTLENRLASRLVDLSRPTSSRYQSYTSRPSSRNMETDYGLSSALGTHNPLTQTHSPMTSSPTTDRRRMLPSYLNRDPHRDLLSGDSDNYEDRNVRNTTRTSAAHQPRRRPRREHHSDTRLGLVSGEDGILARYRRRSLGGLSPPREEDLFDEEASGAGRNRPYSRTATAGDAPPPRPSSRLEIPQENSSSASSQEDLSTRNSYQRPRQRQQNNQPPSSSSSSQNQASSRSSNQAEPRNRYNQKGRALVRFGSRGNGYDEFTWPRGVAVSPIDDSIFIADSSNHRVQVFDSSGDYLRTFGSYGQDEGEFDCLAGITVNNLGQVIISDRYNHRIQIFDHSFNFVTAFGEEGSQPGQLCYPWGIACDNMGFIYVCDKENNRIQVFQSNGSFVRCFGEQGDDIGQLDNPQYVAVSPDNKIYVSDSSNHRIQVFSMYGDFLFTFGDSGTGNGEVKYPRGIAIDSQGFVAVADSGNNRVQIFRPNGTYYSMFGSWGNENGQFKALEGLAILTNGNLVVSDRENHRIQIF